MVPLGRNMSRKSPVAGLVAGLVFLFLVAALAALLAAVGVLVWVYVENKNPISPSDHFYSKAAVATDAGICSEVGR